MHETKPAGAIAATQRNFPGNGQACLTSAKHGNEVSTIVSHEREMAGRVEKVFAEILRLPVESITDALSPDNTPKWDSVAGIDLTLAIEDEFGVTFTTKEIVAMRSVARVKQILSVRGIADV